MSATTTGASQISCGRCRAAQIAISWPEGGAAFQFVSSGRVRAQWHDSHPATHPADAASHAYGEPAPIVAAIPAQLLCSASALLA
jgi:hypothetical protein